MRGFVWTSIVAGFVMVAAACSVTVTRPLNASDIEEQIASDIARQREVEAAVDCPEDVEAEAGGRFTCTATDGEGNSLEVSVVQTDNSGHVDWRLGMLDLGLIEEKVAVEVTRSVGVPVSLECPRILVSSRQGSSVDCRVTDATGARGVVRVTTEDDEGNIGWELNP